MHTLPGAQSQIFRFFPRALLREHKKIHANHASSSLAVRTWIKYVFLVNFMRIINELDKFTSRIGREYTDQCRKGLCFVQTENCQGDFDIIEYF